MMAARERAEEHTLIHVHTRSKGWRVRGASADLGSFPRERRERFGGSPVQSSKLVRTNLKARGRRSNAIGPGWSQLPHSGLAPSNDAIYPRACVHRFSSERADSGTETRNTFPRPETATPERRPLCIHHRNHKMPRVEHLSQSPKSSTWKQVSATR